MPNATLTVTIDESTDLILPSPPWLTVENLLDVETPTDIDYEDVPIPGQDGEVPREEFYAPSQWTLRLNVHGGVRYDGDTGGTTKSRMAENVAWLRAACAPIGTGDGTRPASYEDPAGAEWVADVKLRLTTTERALTWGKFLLTVRIPTGFWTPAEP